MGRIGNFLCRFLKHRWHYHPRIYNGGGQRDYESAICRICGEWFTTPDDANCCIEQVLYQIDKRHRMQEKQRRYIEQRDRQEKTRLENIEKSKRANVCPYCGGEVVMAAKWLDYDKDCRRCGRGWRIDEDGNWHALFDAADSIFTPADVLGIVNEFTDCSTGDNEVF